MDKGSPTASVENHNAIKGTSGAGRNIALGTKGVKPVHRNSKRSSQSLHSPVHDHTPLSPHSSNMDRHKRVWKACERCRQKKTKCDGEFPCKRCKDDGLVCTAGLRKKTKYKQLPRGYAEVLENTQLILIATVHNLYTMVRNGQQWHLAEPELNDRGQPVIHSIATLFGSIRPTSDADLPPRTIFPEDEAGLSKLAAALEVHQQMDHETLPTIIKTETESKCKRTKRFSSSELDNSDFEQDYQKTMMINENVQTLSPQSSNPYNDFDTSTKFNKLDPTALFRVESSSSNSASYPTSNMSRPTFMSGIQQLMHQMDMNMADMMLSQGLVDSEFSTLKPHTLSCPNPEVILGVSAPNIYLGYSTDPLCLLKHTSTHDQVQRQL